MTKSADDLLSPFSSSFFLLCDTPVSFSVSSESVDERVI